MTLTVTSSLESFTRLWLSASTEPCTSALTTIGSSFRSPSLIWLNRSSSDILVFVSSSISTLCCAIKVSEKLLASLSFSQQTKTSPASGTSLRPMIDTGVDGPADLIERPNESSMARTRPWADPAAITSPVCRVPFWTSMFATAPLPLSRRASRIRPRARRSGFAFSSSISDCRRIISIRSEIPSPVLADTGTKIVLPPQSSGISSCSESSCLTRSIFASSLSILLTATITSTSAALAWLIASTVCGITPSSAATTRTAISVELAPRIRMAVNASCPGVSRKVIVSFPTFTTEAPMCCVIPPAS